MNKKAFLMNGAVMTFIAIFMRSTNIYYRSYLTDKIGAEGMGLYQLIFSVFILAITLSTSGISLAVTRLVSSLIASGKRNQIPSLVKKCLSFCFILSLSISALFIFFSDFAATNFLGNPKAADCLKILGIGLPFMSLCTCMKGYFLAVDEVVSCGMAELSEQVITIGSTVLIFTFFPFDSLESACVAAMCASSLGELCSFIIDSVSLKFSLKKNCPIKREKATGVFKGLAHIALPCTFSSAARSFLSMGENLLIPNQLQRGGLSYSSSMSQYGLLQGMALPILYFPSAFISSFAILLIPKICKEMELNHHRNVAAVTNKALSATVSFGIITAGSFFVFSEPLAVVLYGSKESAQFIKILAPLVPLMYLDIVVDCILKGLDQQLHSMKYNIIDSALRVGLILIFMSRYQMQSYIAILFFSTIFNASLSISKVLSVTKCGFVFLKKMPILLIFSSISIYLSLLIIKPENTAVGLILSVTTAYSLYTFLNFIYKKSLAHFKSNKSEIKS